MNWRIMMLSGPLFAPFSGPVVAVASVISVEMNLAEDGTDELVVTAPVEAAWLGHVQPRRVLWVWIDGEVTEWLVARKQDALGDSTATVHCEPLHRILPDLGIIEHVPAPGSVPMSNQRGVNGRIENFQYTYSQQHLERRGVDGWIGIGENDFPDKTLTFAFDNLTVWGLTTTLRDKVLGVARLRRDTYERRYLIDILESFVQAGAPEFWLSEGRNLFRLIQSFDRSQMRNTIRPVGDLPPGEEQRATISEATFPVIAIAGDVLTVGRHKREDDTNQGPVNSDGQWADVLIDGDIVYPGQYAQAPDGSCWKIESTTAHRTIDLETGGGAAFAVGDHLRIVADADGTGITEIPDPIGIQEARGVVQGTVELPYLGYRNFARNPDLQKFGDDAPTQVVAGAMDGNHAGATSINLKNLPPGLEIKANDVLQGQDPGTDGFDRITADATVGGGGTVTVTIATARSGSDNDHAAIWRQQDRDARYWTRLPANAGMAAPLRSLRHNAATLSALANGTHTATRTFVVDGLVPGTFIPPGSIVEPTGFARAWVIEGATVDGGGTATLILLTATSAADNAAVTIRVAELGMGTGYVISHPSSYLIGQSLAPFISQDVWVPYFESGVNKLWATVDIVGMAQQGASGWTTAGAHRPPRIIIANSGGTELVGANADDWSPGAAGSIFTQTLRLGYDLPSSASLKIQFRWPFNTTTALQSHPWVWVRFLQLHRAVEASLPFVNGSAADDLIDHGQALASIHAQWAATYRASEADLAAALNLPSGAPELSFGSVVRLNAHSQGVRHVIQRIVGMKLQRGSRVRELTLGSAPRHFVDQLRKVTKRSFVNVSVTVNDDGEARQTALASTDPPVFVPAPGFNIPAGTTQDGVIEVGLPVEP
jgi:hypothetical protein